MCDTNFRRARVCFWLAVLSAILGLVLVLPSTASAGDSTIWVAPPNGEDDTLAVQAGLNECVARGPDCTVQLQAGKYLTKQIVTYNFQGTFKGMGKDSTTIEALPNLPVTINQDTSEELPQCQPNITTCFWPSLVMFVDGNIHVSDLAIRVTSVPATQPWFVAGAWRTFMLEALGFRGQYPMHVWIDRIWIEGEPDNSPNNLGFNVVNGAHFTGGLPRGPKRHDYYFLSGSFTVRNSDFRTLFDGISQDGFVKSSRITIGGSPSAGNHLEGLYTGIDMETLEDSVVKISYNESSGIATGMWVVPWIPAFVSSSPSRYLIHDNKFFATGQFGDGIFLFDNLTDPWIQSAIWDNTVVVQNSLSEGIGVHNTTGTATWNNLIAGSDGFDAIGLYSTALDTVIKNDVSGFTVDGTVGAAQIYLDPSATSDLVVCPSPSDTVLNLGTNNLVIGCQKTGTTSEASTGRMALENSLLTLRQQKPR